MPTSSSLLIKDLNLIYKPRERLIKLGANNLTSQELLAILLRTGSHHVSALKLAQSLLKNKNLLSLSHISLAQLTQIKGIGPAKAATLLACFELATRLNQSTKLIILNQPEKIFYQAYDIKDKKQEFCLALYVDGQRQLLSKKIIAIGSLNQNYLEIRDILAPALKLPAAGFFLIHNHPSGNVDPSDNDIAVTDRIAEGANLLGVELIDHLIVSHRNFFSFKNAGLM